MIPYRRTGLGSSVHTQEHTSFNHFLTTDMLYLGVLEGLFLYSSHVVFSEIVQDAGAIIDPFVR